MHIMPSENLAYSFFMFLKDKNIQQIFAVEWFCEIRRLYTAFSNNTKSGTTNTK